MDEADDRFQRRVVTQTQVFLKRNVELLADGREGLRLFHRVDAEVGLQIEVELEWGKTRTASLLPTE